MNHSNAMKLVTWNCQGAYRKKAEPIATYRPDIAVIQECEALDRLAFAGNSMRSTTQAWFGNSNHKGVGVFSYTDLNFELYEAYDPTLRYCIPLRVTGRLRFNLLAIWAMNHPERKRSYIAQVYQALETYQAFIRQADTLLAGDFNSNKRWDSTPKLGNHTQVVESLAGEKIVSVYHHYFGEAQGQESRPTLFMQRKQKSVYHVDYCFAPEQWASRLSSVVVGSYETWRQWSDHCPLFVEFEL
jgi:endonuclease/exonuclease/phosphatase family metal-dependent hydrolase